MFRHTTPTTLSIPASGRQVDGAHITSSSSYVPVFALPVHISRIRSVIITICVSLRILLVRRFGDSNGIATLTMHEACYNYRYSVNVPMILCTRLVSYIIRICKCKRNRKTHTIRVRTRTNSFFLFSGTCKRQAD